MKFPLLLSALAVACVLLVFVAPHHRGTSSTFKPCRLGEIYRAMFRDLLASFRDESSGLSGRGPVILTMLGLLGVWAAAFPVVLASLVHWWPPLPGRGAVYVFAGLAVMLGAAANLIVMVASHMVIGFSTTSASHDGTAFIWIIPLFQAACGLVGILTGCSGRMAGWLGAVLG